jgi:hypothetical protein
MKKIIWGSLIVFAATWATDWLVHGWFLKDAYMETSTLWRAEGEMQGQFATMLLGQWITGFFFFWIFWKGWENKGMSEGIRFGLMLGGFEAGKMLIMHSVSPYPTSLTLSWIAWGFVQSIGIGLMCAWLTQKWWTPATAGSRA